MVESSKLVQRDGQGRAIAVNLDLKNPSAQTELDHRQPTEIVDGLIKPEHEVLALLDEIATLLPGSRGE